MIPINTDFQEIDFITAFTNNAHSRQYVIHFLARHNPCTVGWTHNLIEQNTHVFMSLCEGQAPIPYPSAMTPEDYCWIISIAHKLGMPDMRLSLRFSVLSETVSTLVVTN